jgi:hypothetical protein
MVKTPTLRARCGHVYKSPHSPTLRFDLSGLGHVCLDEPGFTALGLDEGDGFFATIHVDVRNNKSA